MNNTLSTNNIAYVAFIAQEIVFAAVCIIGLMGNTLVIYVVVRFSKMQTVTNMYILNLAIADECFLIGIPFLIVTMMKGHWIFGEAMCKIYFTLTSINQFTSSIFLFIMSADRYIAVCHPISSPKWRTPLISNIVSIAAWAWSILLMIPIIVRSKEIDKDNQTKSCQVVWTDSTNTTELDRTAATTFTLYTFVFSFATPLCLILVFYCLVIRKLKTVGPQNKSKEKRRSHRKVTNLVLTVVTVYILCWLPYHISQIAILFSTEERDSFIVIHLLASCLSYSNSAINPILYAFLSDNFKKSFLKACTCAAKKDVNAVLHMENSVFPKRNKHNSSRHKASTGTQLYQTNEEECEVGPLVSKVDLSTSALTMSSRSNFTVFSDVGDTVVRNGIPLTSQSIKL